MKAAALAIVLVALQLAIAPAWGADDPSVERLATCRDSWFDWKKSDDAQLKIFGEHFRTAYTRNQSDGFFVPKSSASIAGLRIKQVFPQSIGMAVGFSVTVDATFRKAKHLLERKFGKSLEKCEVSDGMRTCELNIAGMRTFMLMASDGAKDATSLLGCYYFYER